MIPVSDGEVNVGDPVANTDDSDAIGVLESICSFETEIDATTQGNFRYDDDNSLVTVALDLLRVLTAQEISDRDDAIALAAAQAANDVAAAALVALGGDPCP